VLAKPILDRLRCPECGEPMAATGDAAAVACRHGHQLPWHDGYLDAAGSTAVDATTSRTFASFGYEWTTFDEVRTEDARFAEVYFRDVDLPALAGKVGLDAGCGKGRYTRFLAPHLDALAALDGSAAVEAAARNLAEFPAVGVVRSDLRRAPFGPAAFDFVTCLGVLHHLADPQAGFRRLVELLAPGGQILVYLYSRPATFGLRQVLLAAATALRTVTVRLPHRLLKLLSAPIAALLYAVFVVPGRYGDRHGGPLAGLPMDSYRRTPLRSLVLDTFDRLSAPVEYRYVWADLEPWFADAGLHVDAARDEAGWFVLATKPADISRSDPPT